MTYPIRIKTTKSSRDLEIAWDLTNYCNFSCRYCFSGASDGDFKVTQDVNLLADNFTHLANQYKIKLGRDNIYLKFGGGEPTLWSDFGELLVKLKEQNSNLYLGVISNGSRTLRWWNEYGVLIDNVTLSFHIGNSNIDHHIAVADALFKLGKKVTVLVLMDPNRWDDCITAVEYMKANCKHRWFIEIKTVIPTPTVSILYTTEQQEYLVNEIKQMPTLLWFLKNIKLIFKGLIKRYSSIATLDNGKTLKATAAGYTSRGWNVFTGWSCDIGLDTLYIKWTGELQGACGQPLFNLDTKFNILENNFVNKFNPVMTSLICKVSLCECQPETHVSKFNLSNRDIGSTRTIIPITDYRVYNTDKRP
jgi:organic radical activating enzyme